MPSVSEPQRRLFGMAYAAKKGKKVKSKKAKELAKRIRFGTLKDFASEVEK